MFENVDGRTDDGVTGILIAHLGAFGSGELITYIPTTVVAIFSAERNYFLSTDLWPAILFEEGEPNGQIW